MAKVNKDSKGRKLRPRESQMADGRYRYRYIDKSGKERVVYSWKLVSTDKVPEGKKDDICLRDKAKSIERDIEDCIDTVGSRMTVNRLIDLYLSTKVKLATKTKNNYLHMWEKNIKDSFLGNMKVCDVKKSNILSFYSYLYEKKNFSVNTIQLYQNLMYPAFQLAVDDNIIRNNPCKNCMKEYARGSMDSTRNALSRQEQSALVTYITENQSDIMYYALIMFMLGTGCRIGETLGITWSDIDFKAKCVRINHQVLYDKDDGKMKFYASLPKNKKSREIPIQESLIKILREHKKNTYFLSYGSEFCVGEYSNFVFINSVGKLPTPGTIDRTLRSIRENYNKREQDLAEEEGRKELLLPCISAHILRHTYCTRMAESRMDIKVLQTIMGHSNIGITMQIYNHVNRDRTQREFERIPDVLGA